jgi:copper transport protein
VSNVAVTAVRWIEYIGLVSFVGAVVVRRLAANPPRLGWARVPLHIWLATACVGGLGLVVASLFADSDAFSPVDWVRCARVVAEIAALVLCLAGLRWVVPLGILATIALALDGHAVSVQPTLGGIVNDALHVLSAGMWAGGILVLATIHPPDGWRSSEGRALLDRFGGVAVVAFAMTALTGVLRASDALSGLSDLWTTSYGVVLSLKTAGVLTMLVMSAIVWRRAPSLARLDAAVVLLVLAATAVLAAYPVPHARGAELSSAAGGGRAQVIVER